MKRKIGLEKKKGRNLNVFLVSKIGIFNQETLFLVETNEIPVFSTDLFLEGIGKFSQGIYYVMNGQDVNVNKGSKDIYFFSRWNCIELSKLLKIS